MAAETNETPRTDASAMPGMPDGTLRPKKKVTRIVVEIDGDCGDVLQDDFSRSCGDVAGGGVSGSGTIRFAGGSVVNFSGSTIRNLSVAGRPVATIPAGARVDVYVTGTVSGNISVGGGVEVGAGVGGGVDAGGSVSVHGAVAGSVDAGGSVTVAGRKRA